MSYSVYRKQRVANIFEKPLTVRHNRNSVNNTDASYVETTNLMIKKIELHPAHTSFTFHSFENDINVGDTISVAIVNGDVLAFVNHSTKKSGCISAKFSLSDWWGFIFYASFPAGICGLIFYSLYSKHGFTPTNIIVAALGITLVTVFYISVSGNATARKALKHLQTGRAES